MALRNCHLFQLLITVVTCCVIVTDASLSKDESKLKSLQTFNQSALRTIHSTIFNQALIAETKVSKSSRSIGGKIFEICVNKSDTVFTTVRVQLSQLFKYIEAGAKNGSCEDLCDDLCFDQHCEMNSFKYGGTCICSRQQKSICSSNMQCTNGQCECIDGYSGDRINGCKKEEVQWLKQSKCSISFNVHKFD
jgi:hypothetical protein